MQTQTSNTLHNAIMEAGGKDHPPIVAPGIDNDIYSTVDACSNACEMWKAIERSQQVATKNRGKAVVNSPQHICDQEPSMVVEDDETSKDKEIDKLMALISLSFKKIYKSTNNNLRTSSNTSRANQDNSPRINRSTGYENQRIGNVAGARETVEDQELEVHYMYMAQIQEVSPYTADSGPIFDAEPLEKKEAQINLYKTHEDKELDKVIALENKVKDKGIVISELKKLIKKLKGKYVDTKFGKSSVTRQQNAFKSQRPSILGKPAIFLDSLERKDFSMSKPQLKSNLMEDRVMLNNSKGKKQEVEDQRMNVKLSKNKTSVTACNDSLNGKTLNVNIICATCGKYVLNEKHDMCVLKSINGVISRTQMPIDVPISTREPKCTVKHSVAKPFKKTVASKSNQKSRNITRKLYERVSKACSWWYPMFTPSGYKWKPKFEKENFNTNVNMPLGIFLGTVKFGNDQIAPILGCGDLVQGAVTIKRVYYVEGLNHNLFSIGQFCDSDLEVAFRKSTCYIPDLKGNDLLTGFRGTNLYSITLQDINSPNPICLMAKATSSHAWLWHRHLSHLNFDTIKLLSKNDIVVGLPKLKFIKDHLCSSYELGKAKRKSFHTETTPSSKRRLQLLHMELCGPMQVASINGKRYVLVIVDDYSRYNWTHFLRSKDETPKVLIDFLRLV
nr:retrovirus-related Pol polyprotein from transposon TNT 1-94 [Tanacetum cinerariifolium]